MAYSYETSSVKTINGEVSGLADVVARQAIANLPTLSGGEGIQIVNEDGKNRIDLGLSAGSNMSFVYDQETNIIRLDAEGGDLSNYYTKTETSSKQQISAALQYVSANAGKTYSGDDPIYVNNETNHIGITGETLSAGPGINIFESGGCVVISAGNDDYNFFPITGTDGTTNYTANCDCSSFYFTTAQSPAGANTTMTVKGVHYQAYPSTDVSASWYNIITQQDKITCSAVKLSTASDTSTFYTSAVPNLNKITFIAPTYGPYETYSALINDGDSEYKVEVDSGCAYTVVRAWNDDRNKDVWFGLGTASYYYIG